MNLLILGATGRTGMRVAGLATDHGHTVTKFVRAWTPDIEAAGTTWVAGDPRRGEDVLKALAGQDAVISCLGQRTPADATLLRDSASAALWAMEQGSAARYIVISQGLLSPSSSPIVALLRLILARHVADSAAMERMVSQSSLDWTIVRPPRLTDGDRAKGYKVAVGRQPSTGWSMQRVDLAAVILDALEQSQYHRMIIGVG